MIRIRGLSDLRLLPAAQKLSTVVFAESSAIVRLSWSGTHLSIYFKLEQNG